MISLPLPGTASSLQWLLYGCFLDYEFAGNVLPGLASAAHEKFLALFDDTKRKGDDFGKAVCFVIDLMPIVKWMLQHLAKEQHNVLIFLPGVPEITQLLDLLREQERDDRNRGVRRLRLGPCAGAVGRAAGERPLKHVSSALVRACE